MLDHEPRELQELADAGVDVDLCGHTHGGQICLPGGIALVANADIDKKQASGLHDYGSMSLHVTNGLGTSKYAPVRIFCPPSAALLRIVERQ